MSGQAFTLAEGFEGEEAALIALWHACDLVRPWNDPHADLARLRASAQGEVILARSAQAKVIGSVMVGHDGHRGWLYYLAVDEAFRRTGLGAALVHAAETWLEAKGAVKSMLMIRSENEAVKAFYNRIGYEEEERIIMSRWLNGNPASQGTKGGQ